MNNEFKSYMILRYGDYRTNPFIILEYDNELLFRIYKEAMDEFGECIDDSDSKEYMKIKLYWLIGPKLLREATDRVFENEQ